MEFMSQEEAHNIMDHGGDNDVDGGDRQKITSTTQRRSFHFHVSSKVFLESGLRERKLFFREARVGHEASRRIFYNEECL